jgi:protein O-GlcNAc transferase
LKKDRLRIFKIIDIFDTPFHYLSWDRQEFLKMKRGKRAKRHKPSSGLDIDQAFHSAFKFHEKGRLDKAEIIYKKILREYPDQPDALHYLGLIAGQRGRTDKAENLMRKAIQILPESAFYHHNFGTFLKEKGRWEESIRSYGEAVKLEPNYVEAHYHMGEAHLEHGDLLQAVTCFQKVLELSPDNADAYGRLGFAFQNAGNLEKAVSCYRKAIEIRPDFAEAWNSLGLALHDLGNLDQAVWCYQKAVEISPDRAEPHENMGNSFQNIGDLEKAISSYKRAMELEPDYREVYAQLFHTLQKACAWQELKDIEEKMGKPEKTDSSLGKEFLESPFVSITAYDQPARNFAVAKWRSSEISQDASRLGVHFNLKDRRHAKPIMTIGYLSGDFHNHPVAQLICGLFRLHDRSEFQVYCYSYGIDDGSNYRKQIRDGCDKFVDVSRKSYARTAQQIYDHEVDILVDLKGHTVGGRMQICALRPAPVQVSYLGFLGTSGADFIDYIITDKIVTPEAHAAYYSESFVYLPHCYQVNNNAQNILKKKLQKADVGLPDDKFVFCSFNQPYKIERVTFELWMRILRRVEESILWLYCKSVLAERNLKREAESQGVNRERLIFAERVPLEDHLLRLQFADLMLDTRVYNGGATTSNALWAGVPVITLLGNHFVSRMSASSLTAIGLPELITHTLEEYESYVLRLARNPDQLQTIRQKIAKNRLVEPLFDTPRFVRNLEKAYKEMWEIFLAGERPRQITVSEN